MGLNEWAQKRAANRKAMYAAMEQQYGGKPVGPPSAPGWYPHPEMAGTQRYWNGSAWTDNVAPATSPAGNVSVLKGARIVALGILIAAGIVFAIWKFSQPSYSDCLNQETDVALGVRNSVSDACIDKLK